MFAELMGKDQGTNRGRGGSMHIADPNIGIFGANGIVAAGLPIAVGAATAAQLRADGSVAVAFFGDGAAAQGAFHEALNLAAVWELPVIFFCENNGYAEFSPASTQHAAPLEQRAAGYGVDYVAVDGNDVVATAAAHGATWSTAIRAGGGPAVVEADHLPVARPLRGRSRSATGRRTRSRSGRRATRSSSTSAGCARPGVGDDEHQGARVVGRRRARRGGRGGPPAWPAPAAATLTDFVVRARAGAGASRRPPAADAPVFRTMDAIRSALEAELAGDDRVFVAGIDVGAGGNVFGLTRGLHDRVR